MSRISGRAERSGAALAAIMASETPLRNEANRHFDARFVGRKNNRPDHVE
jgi:hypothetical protein